MLHMTQQDVSTHHPAVTTVMEPSKASYLPYNGNITVKIAARLSVTPQVYGRDLAIAAVVCFTGGVGLTLMVVLIHYRVSRRRRARTLRKERGKEQEEMGERPEEQEHSAWERRKDLASPGDRRKPWDGQAGILDPSRGVGSGGGHLRCPHCRGVGSGGGHLRCPHCRGVGSGGGHLRCPHCRGVGLGAWGRRAGGLAEGENQTRSEQGGGEGRSGMPPHKRALIPNMVTNGGPGYPPPRDPRGILRPYTPGQEPGQSRTHGDLSGRQAVHYRPDGAPKARAVLKRPGCDHRRQTSEYGAEDVSSSQERFSLSPRPKGPKGRGPEDHSPKGRGPEDHSPKGREPEDHSPSERRGRRNVTFYLESPLDPRREASRRSRDKESRTQEKRGEGGRREGRQKTRVQSSRLLKVKLSLSPVRRNKVHPGKSSEKKSSRRERRGREGRKDNTLDGKGDKGGGRKENKDEPMKSKTSKSKKAVGVRKTSSEEKPSQQSSELDHHDSVETTDQSETSRAPEGLTHTNGQRLNLQLDPPPFPPSAPASVSLLGIPSSARPAPGLSLRANLPQTPTALHSQINSSLAANVAYPGLRGLKQNTAAPADTQSVALQRGLRPSASAASLLASPGRSHPLLGRAVSTPSIYTVQSGELASGLAFNPTMNPSHNIQSLSRLQLPAENLPLAQGPGLQAGQEPQAQGPGLQAGQEPQAQAPVAGRVGAGPSGDAGGGDGGFSGAHWSAGGGPEVASHSAGVARPEGVAAAGSAEGGVASAPGESAAEGVVSSPGGVFSSPWGVATAGSQALLQQEYLSEDGGSSPKRKLKLVLPEKATSRPPTALERKIR
ncbi:unnamed protein product [Lota lota]